MIIPKFPNFLKNLQPWGFMMSFKLQDIHPMMSELKWTKNAVIKPNTKFPNFFYH
jgi:hypothetical protein